MNGKKERMKKSAGMQWIWEEVEEVDMADVAILGLEEVENRDLGGEVNRGSEVAKILDLAEDVVVLGEEASVEVGERLNDTPETDSELKPITNCLLSVIMEILRSAAV